MDPSAMQYTCALQTIQAEKEVATVQISRLTGLSKSAVTLVICNGLKKLREFDHLADFIDPDTTGGFPCPIQLGTDDQDDM